MVLLWAVDAAQLVATPLHLVRGRAWLAYDEARHRVTLFDGSNTWVLLP